MTLLALGLIVIAAICHASWNLIAKRTGGGVAFVWLFTSFSALIYAPIVAYFVLVRSVDISSMTWIFIGASALAHLLYILSLQYGYSVGDLSLVYPVARGAGPFLAMFMAIPLLGERPSWIALLGGVLIIGSVFSIAGGLRGLLHPRANTRIALRFGLLTACFICAYTLMDKHAVYALSAEPLVYNWLVDLVRVSLLTPFAWPRRTAAAEVWREHRLSVLAVAILSPLAYILVLTAMTFTPVSYVAPAREISIVIGAWLGSRILHEHIGPRRWLGVGTVCIGVILLALG